VQERPRFASVGNPDVGQMCEDLGRQTETIAKRITLFDPDQTWKKL
jgi:hypothetical protein